MMQKPSFVQCVDVPLYRSHITPFHLPPNMAHASDATPLYLSGSRRLLSDLIDKTSSFGICDSSSSEPASNVCCNL